jgi:hypothetical protein
MINKKIILMMVGYLWILLLSSACDSPIQNRVRNLERQNNSNQIDQSTVISHGEYQITAQWLTGPFGQITQLSELLVMIRNPDGELSDLNGLEQLYFYAAMPSMGHPMDDAGDFVRLHQGIYLNQTIRFNMPGDWKMELWWMDDDYNILEAVSWDEDL